MTRVTSPRTRLLTRLAAGAVTGLLTLSLAPGAVGTAAAEPDDLVFSEAARQAPQQTEAARRAARGPAQARVPRIKWRACEPGLRSKRARCAVVQVPLDYDNPRGATTKLALLKYRAAKPKQRLGALFVNPGGPGGEARGFATAAGRLLSPAVDRRFDIVGIDPRGVGRSGTAACRGTSAVPPFPAVGYPITAAQVTQQIRRDRALRQICRNGATRIVDHATTADNARDMELVRRAMGQQRINYYGISYGSYLGQTYAALFPGRIRALAIDGILDPIAWSTGPRKGAIKPFTWRLRSGEGAYRGLTAAFAECDRAGAAKCDLAPSSATKWRDLLRAARQGTLVLPDGDGGTTRITEQDLVGTALSAFYTAAAIDPFFSFLADLHGAAVAPGARRSAPQRELGSQWQDLQQERAERERRPFSAVGAAQAPALAQAPGRRYTVDVSFQAVGCSDTRNPRAPRAWERAARQTRDTPWFGRLWAWASSACAERGIGDGSDAFRGPWQTRTSTPLLIVGNEYDPATPIRGARRANKLFTGSSMLYYDGWGHGNLGENRCVTEAYRQYFVFRKLPRNGATCRPDSRLFG